MPDESFAADLEFLRLNAGLSLRELVRLTGIPRSTLSDGLAGRRAPRLETVLAIVRACRAEPDPWRRRWAEMSKQRKAPGPGPDPAGTPAAGAPSSPATTTASPPPTAAPAVPTAVPPAVPIPAQLPRDIAGFASRERELARLEDAGIAVIHGRPGAGKTALAVHWAHSAAARYPDGKLFLNLRGHHATLRPVTAVEAMGRMLGALGLPFAPLTEEPDEAAGLWRSTLAGRRLLILLDDAINAEQIRPLLPGAAGCTLIVTSRHHLADLVVQDGAESILVDVLPADSSTLLLGHVAGTERVAVEPDTEAEALELLAACDLGLGEVDCALDEAHHALALHTASGARLAEITSRCVLARAHQQNAKPEAAGYEWRAAHKLVDELALPDAAPVRLLVSGRDLVV